MAAADVVLVADGLVKTYGEGAARRVALGGVDLALEAGEVLAVTGSSGSGKTTLLHCLAGLTGVDSGRVLVDGVDLAALDDDARTDLRGRTMGLVLQSGNLLGALTVAENVELPLVARGVPGPEVRSRAGAALSAVGLGDAGDRLPAVLSGGEQQRVAIARVLASRPSLVLADEPTAALDTATAAEVVDLLRLLGDAGAGVLVATHASAVARAATRHVVLADGLLAG